MSAAKGASEVGAASVWPLGLLCPCIDFSELSPWLQGDREKENDDRAGALGEQTPLIKGEAEAEQAPPAINDEMRRVLQEAFARSQLARRFVNKSRGKLKRASLQSSDTAVVGQIAETKLVETPSTETYDRDECNRKIAVRSEGASNTGRPQNCQGSADECSSMRDAHATMDEAAEVRHIDYRFTMEREGGIDLDFKMIQLSRDV